MSFKMTYYIVMENDEHGGDTVREKMILRRKELGLTQQDLAESTGRKRNTIASYEKGTIDPPVSIAIKIKQTLKTDDDSIFLNTSDI